MNYRKLDILRRTRKMRVVKFLDEHGRVQEINAAWSNALYLAFKNGWSYICYA